jgi:hypothetical protein
MIIAEYVWAFIGFLFALRLLGPAIYLTVTYGDQSKIIASNKKVAWESAVSVIFVWGMIWLFSYFVIVGLEAFYVS